MQSLVRAVTKGDEKTTKSKERVLTNVKEVRNRVKLMKKDRSKSGVSMGGSKQGLSE